MPDWVPYVRDHLPPLAVTGERLLEITEELAQHLEERYADLLRTGVSEPEAVSRVKAELDDWEAIGWSLRGAEHRLPGQMADGWRRARSEQIPRQERSVTMLTNWWQDVRYGLRLLVKSPGFTAAAMLTLALGIGANAAVFSVVDAVVFTPLPYEDPGRLVMIGEQRENGGASISVSLPNYLDWRDMNGSFTEMTAVRGDQLNLTGRGEPVRVPVVMVSAPVFGLLGATPMLGRTLLPEEDQPGAAPAVVASYGAWQRRLGASREIVGEPVTLGGITYTVVGVMGPEFSFPPGTMAEFFLPIGRFHERYAERNNHPGLSVVARLKPGITLEQARGDMSRVMGLIRAETGHTHEAELDYLHERLIGQSRPALLALLGAVGFVLLMACVNVGGLLLSRSSAREREMAVRTAMGAGRVRLFRQLLTESVLIGALGGAAGLAVGYLGTRYLADVIQTIVPPNAPVPGINDIAVDGRVLFFTLAVSLASGVIFGLVPALTSTKLELHEVLKEGGRSSTARRAHRVRSVMVVCEVALSLVLLVGAGLMIRTFGSIQDADAGLRPQGVLTMELSLPDAYRQPSRQAAFFQELSQRLAAVSGVESAGVARPVPLAGGGSQTSPTARDSPVFAPDEGIYSDFFRVTPDYFDALGVQLMEGRHFEPTDTAETAPVVMIDTTFAQAVWPGESPIGRYLEVNGTRRVVGVVNHVKNFGVAAESRFQFYLPFYQVPWQTATVVIRSDLAPETLADLVRREVRFVDAAQPVGSMRTMEQVVQQSIAPQVLVSVLLAVFALIALVLSAVGIYGVMGYAVSQRTQEFGLRLALGAQTSAILGGVVRRGLWLTAIGLVIGLLAAFGMTRALSSVLFGVTATDPLTFASVALLLLVVAGIACYLSARRATQIDPLAALRVD